MSIHEKILSNLLNQKDGVRWGWWNEIWQGEQEKGMGDQEKNKRWGKRYLKNRRGGTRRRVGQTFSKSKKLHQNILS